MSFNDVFKKETPIPGTGDWKDVDLVLFPFKEHVNIVEKYKICIFRSISKRRLYDKDSWICHSSKFVKLGNSASLFLMNTRTPIQRHACMHTQKDWNT